MNSEKALSWGSSALLACVIGTQAVGQQDLGEYRSDCKGREIVVWGTDGDLRLLRGQEDIRGVRVRSSSEITWFCDSDRRTFFCQDSDRANFLDVEWRRGGPVTFFCMRR